MWGGAEGLGSAFGRSSLSVPSLGTVPRPGTHGENPLKASPGRKRRKRVPFLVGLFPGGPSSPAVWEDAEGPLFLSATPLPQTLPCSWLRENLVSQPPLKNIGWCIRHRDPHTRCSGCRRALGVKRKQPVQFQHVFIIFLYALLSKHITRNDETT